ncbi:MAG: hypothetical protein RLZZ336_799 [Cyanobacteriota bacterium]
MLKSASGAAVAALLVLAGAWVWPPAGQAACLPTPAVPGTNCATFTPDSPSDVLNIYWLYNLALNRFFQLSVFTTAEQPVVIQQPQWSQDGSNWTSFTPLSLTAVDSGFAFTNVVSLQEPIGHHLHVRYTIPAAPLNPAGTLTQDDVVSSQLISNANGATAPQWDSGRDLIVPVLRAQAGNRYLVEQRDHVDAPDAVPGPLPLLGAIGGLSACRRLRRRFRLASESAVPGRVGA